MRRSLAVLLLSFVATACGTDPDITLFMDAGTSPPPDAGQTAQDAGHDAGAMEDSDGGTDPTWYRDVLPIIQSSCQGCHLEGGIAPFSLDTYASAALMHLSIADAVSTGRMPPWKPDDACIPLEHSRRLSAADVATINQWSSLGAPEGNPAHAPPPPIHGPGLEWVDATLSPEAAYVPAADVSDDYRCFVVPPALASQKDIVGFDVIPGTPNQVHHVILFSMPEADARALDLAEDGLGWTCYGAPGPDSSSYRMIGGWVPGTTATRYPDKTGVRVAGGSVVVMQVHYNLANGPPREDLTQVNLQYAKSPVSEPALIFPVTVPTFAIPPNSTGYSATGSFSLSQYVSEFLLPSVTIYGATPHMHELGRRITSRNVTTGQCLIDIPDWDFHWQQGYEYQTPINLKNKDVVELTCTWDNPDPRTVTWGEGTSDEMCVNFFYVTGIPPGLL